MITLLKHFVIRVLSIEMSCVLARFRPTVIAVTGSVGKTSTKEAIYTILKNHMRTARSPKSYNSQIGVPLAVLGLKSAFRSPLGWAANLFVGAWRIVSYSPYPEVLVLEMGVGRPRDLNAPLKAVRPSVGVVTAIGDIPVHVEFFSGSEAVAREKVKLLRPLREEDYAVLNYDDETVRAMREKTKGIVLTYGFGEGADVRASNYNIISRRADSKNVPEGISFKMEHEGHTVPVRMHGVFGRQQVYAALAGAAVGIAKGLNLIEISEALGAYEVLPGRMRVLDGVKGSYILDDTYNSSPLAAHAALDVLSELSAHRKISVLGDMLELGKYTISAHRAIGKRAREVCNIIITVGARARFIAEEAHAGGMPHESIFTFSSAEEAGKKLQEILKPGDLALIKGSQGMRLEKVAEEVMAKPEKAGELLVRQEQYWKKTGESPLNEMSARLVGLLLFLIGIGVTVLAAFWGVLLMLIGVFLLVRTFLSRNNKK